MLARSTFSAWRRQTPAGFLFAVKASRYLTLLFARKQRDKNNDELNDRQRDLAAEKGIDYFDTRPLSQGHDMCAPPAERYVEGYLPTNAAVPLHPTALGAAAVGNALTDYLVVRSGHNQRNSGPRGI